MCCDDVDGQVEKNGCKMLQTHGTSDKRTTSMGTEDKREDNGAKIYGRRTARERDIEPAADFERTTLQVSPVFDYKYTMRPYAIRVYIRCIALKTSVICTCVYFDCSEMFHSLIIPFIRRAFSFRHIACLVLSMSPRALQDTGENSSVYVEIRIPSSLVSPGNEGSSSSSSTGDSASSSVQLHQSNRHAAAKSCVESSAADGLDGASATQSLKEECPTKHGAPTSGMVGAALSDAASCAGENSSSSWDSKRQRGQLAHREAAAAGSGGTRPLNSNVIVGGSAAANAVPDTVVPVCQNKAACSTRSGTTKQGAKRVHFASDSLLQTSSAPDGDAAAGAGGKASGQTAKAGPDVGKEEAAAGASRGEEGRRITPVKDKWRLLPAYLAAKGLVHQHIESYNYFVKRELHEILRAPSNRLVKSDVDPSFFIEFLSIYAGTPCYYEEGMIVQRLTPHICRTRELTYAAPLFVDAEYSRGEEIIRRRKVEIGLLPVMLKSDLCVLHGKDTPALQRLGECPYDPGGYFIVRGTEKVRLLFHDQFRHTLVLHLRSRTNMCAPVCASL
ncbi:UNVERIFIED_CONTAM: hypothetical protein H355_007859 [Colinus virginianus]|nr:hypothetical protein H355_007859 [Colinus virginianus]